MSREPENIKPGIRVTMCGKGARKFNGMLDDANIIYTSHQFPPETIVAAGETVAVAVASISALGVVIAAWINSRKSRSASVTHVHNSITQINITMKPDDIAKALETARTVMIVDTEPNEE
jgi:hypothetical protein